MALPTIEELSDDIAKTLEGMLAQQLRVEENLKVLLQGDVRIEVLHELVIEQLNEKFEWSAALVERSGTYNSERIERVAKEYNLSLHRCQKLVEVP
jgi:hypothetical protein